MSTHAHPSQPSQPDPLARWLTGRPCPRWCEHHGDHSYDHDPFAEPAQRWHRVHSRTVHTETRWPISLDVQQADTTTAPDEPPTRYRPEYVLVFPSCTVEMASAAELRDLAALLGSLADHLEVQPFGTEHDR
jgi:hypothetical protein